jgi:hypothetical protein
MKSRVTIIVWLRGLKRGYKFAILLIAAWAPFLFPEHPVVTGLLMGLCTAVFFVATGSGRPTPTVTAGSVDPVNLKDSHVEP